MTWEIVAGLAVLLGMIATVITWSTKLAQSIATLEAAIANLTKSIDMLRDENKEDHKVIHNQLDDHERRITILEQ